MTGHYTNALNCHQSKAGGLLLKGGLYSESELKKGVDIHIVLAISCNIRIVMDSNG
jgi:hypothetical protein